MSNKGLARRIVEATASWKEPIRADHNDVRKWLDGMVPKDPKPRIIADVLSAKLGRQVSLDDIGLGESDASGDDVLVDEGLSYQADSGRAVNLLRQLTEADLANRQRIIVATAREDVASQIITGYMFASPVVLDLGNEGPLRGAAVAARIRRTTAHLMDMDFQFGGGHTRRMLIEFFRDQVVPLLRRHHPDAIRKEIFGAAAEVAQLLGWSAYDAGRHGVATRYFTQGLKLAREAEDHMLGARMLSSLSHQANYLGRFSDAVNFARAAQSATLGHATKAVTAMFLSMEARALASLGDKAGTAATLHRAEQAFETRDPALEPDWIVYFDALELAGEASHCFRDLGDGSRAKHFAEQAIDPLLTPPRTRAFIQMVSAAGSIANGEPYEALALATEAVDLADGLQSARYLRYLKDFHRSLGELKGGQASTREFGVLLKSRYPKLSLSPVAA
jgi:tetratricopeptide (TPR) repeat protein